MCDKYVRRVFDGLIRVVQCIIWYFDILFALNWVFLKFFCLKLYGARCCILAILVKPGVVTSASWYFCYGFECISWDYARVIIAEVGIGVGGTVGSVAGIIEMLQGVFLR